MLLAPYSLTVVDYRTFGFFWGLLALLLMPFPLKPLRLSPPTSFTSAKYLAIAISLALGPAGILLVVGNYLRLLPVGLLEAAGPFLFVLGIAPLVKFLLNWRHLEPAIRSVVAVECALYSLSVLAAVTGTEITSGQSFTLDWIVGSWVSA